MLNESLAMLFLKMARIPNSLIHWRSTILMLLEGAFTMAGLSKG